MRYPMEMQEVIIIVLFLGAAFFMGRRLYKQYKAESGCASGCDACSPEKKEFKLPGHLKS